MKTTTARFGEDVANSSLAALSCFHPILNTVITLVHTHAFSDELCDCGKAFKGPHLRTDLQLHKESDCPAAIVFCENMCGAKMERRFRSAHVATECTKRLTHCPLRCGADDLYLDHVSHWRH